MNHFSKIASQLSVAIEHQKSVPVSFWGTQAWKELFKWKRGGISRIKPRKVAGIFSTHALQQLNRNGTELADNTAENAENILCNQYKTYTNLSWFWDFGSKLWMWISQPISLYRQIYALVTLRNLQARYADAGKQADMISHVRSSDWSDFFAVVMNGLSAYLSSLLPKKTGFFEKLFERSEMYSHVIALKQFKNEALEFLRNGINESYVELLIRAQACSTAQAEKDLNLEIVKWYTAQVEAIQKELDHVDQKFQSHYKQLLKNLGKKYLLLTGMVKTAMNSADQQDELVLSESVQQNIKDNYANLHSRLINLRGGCTVQLNNKNCLHKHTYILHRDSDNHPWILSYRKSPKSDLLRYEIKNIQGLSKAILLFSMEDITQCIIAHHHQRQDIEPVSVSDSQRIFASLSPEHFGKLLLNDYSRQFEGQLSDEKDSRKLKEKLPEYTQRLFLSYQHIKIRTKECLEHYHCVEQDISNYSKNSGHILNMAMKVKTMCMDMMLFENQSDMDKNRKAEQLIEKLENKYRQLYETKDFTGLSTSKKKYLTDESSREIENIRKLITLFKRIQVIDNKKSHHSSSIEDKFREEFLTEKENLTQEQKTSLDANCINETDYSLLKNILHQTTRNCFLYYVRNSSANLSKLEEIYIDIETVHMKYLDDFRKKIGAIIVFPKKQNPDETPLGSIRRISRTPGRVRTILEQLREEFEELKTPKKNMCHWIRMSEVPDQGTIKSLAYPAYVYVVTSLWTDLYFVDNETSLIEYIKTSNNIRAIGKHFENKVSGSFLTEEECVYIAGLTNHCHDRKIGLYLAILDLLVKRLEGAMWGIFKREDLEDNRCDLVWTSRQPDLDEMKKSPVSCYIFTFDDQLYYYSRQENTLVQCTFVSRIKQQEFKNEFSKIKGRIKLQPGDHEFINSKIVLVRKEEYYITTRQARINAKNEIKRLLREMSVLYHPDKYQGSGEWIQFLKARKKQVKEKIEYTFHHQSVIRNDDDFQPVNPKDIEIYIPSWLAEDKHTITTKAANYLQFMRNDEIAIARNQKITNSTKFREEIAIQTKEVESRLDEIAEWSKTSSCDTAVVSEGGIFAVKSTSKKIIDDEENDETSDLIQNYGPK